MCRSSPCMTRRVWRPPARLTDSIVKQPARGELVAVRRACARRACLLRAKHDSSPVFFDRRRVRRIAKSNSSLLPDRGGVERRQTRGRAKPPVDGRRSHPVGRFAKASPRSLRNEAPPGAPHPDKLAPSGLFKRRSNDRSGRAFGTWTSHARQPAPGAGSYCPGAEPRHRPGTWSALLRIRGAAAADGGVSPLGRPAET